MSFTSRSSDLIIARRISKKWPPSCTRLVKGWPMPSSWSSTINKSWMKGKTWTWENRKGELGLAETCWNDGKIPFIVGKDGRTAGTTFSAISFPPLPLIKLWHTGNQDLFQDKRGLCKSFRSWLPFLQWHAGCDVLLFGCVRESPENRRSTRR